MDATDRLATLSPAEREVLKLYLQRSDVKVIARALGVSDHAVTKRLANARSKLGVTRSIDAALMLGRQDDATIYKTVEVKPLAPIASPSPPPMDAASEEGAQREWALFPTEGHPWNTLPLWLRVVWMVAALLAIMASTMLALSIGQGISSVVRPHL